MYRKKNEPVKSGTDCVERHSGTKEMTTEELLRLKDEDIDYSDIPELDDSFWSNARVVMPERRNKTQITAKFDADMVAWFKAQGRGYQARMNAVLRSYYEAARQTGA